MFAQLNSFGACLGLAIMLGACASSPENSAVLLDETARASLGTIGLVAVGELPEPEALGPVASVGDNVIGGGAGLLVGGAVGVGVGAIIIGSAACGPFAFGCAAAALSAAAAVTVIGAAAGTTVGVVIASDRSLPTDTETVLEAALADALEAYDVRNALKDGVLAANAHASTQMIDLGVNATLPDRDAADYRHIVPPEVDSLLEVGIAQIVLTQIEDEDEEFSLLINVYGELTDATGHETIWVNDQIVYVSAPANLSAWIDPDSDRLKVEINDGLNELSEEIDRQLFGAGE